MIPCRCSKPRSHQSALIVLVSILLASVSGCQTPDPPTFVKTSVAGRVTLNGEPVYDAKLVWIPESLRDQFRNAMPLAYAVTDAEGKFQLSMANEETRILPGRYRVIISKPVREPDQSFLLNLDPNLESLLPDSIKPVIAGNDIDVFPAQFNRDSDLVIEVKSDRERHNLNLDFVNRQTEWTLELDTGS